MKSKSNGSKIFFWGGVGTVTGSNFILEVSAAGENSADSKIGRLMIDCGLFQGGGEAYAKNKEAFPYDPTQIQTLIVTHGHMDHIGRIPKLVHDGFAGKIISTPETKEIAGVMFDDALKIMTETAKQHGDAPMYARADVDKALLNWETHPYHEVFEPFANSLVNVPGNFGITARLLDAGHILGSAMVELTRKVAAGESGGASDRKIIFTGDTGNTPASIVRDTEPLSGANYVVIDSTYGDREHEPWEEGTAKLKEVVKKTIEKKGVLLIPAFSLERTHIILYELNNMFEKHELENIPVYLDTPLANRLMPLYERSTALFNDKTQKIIASGDDIFQFPKLQMIKSPIESAKIERTANPKIIIAGSGMSSGGRIPHHEAIFLPDTNATLLLTGFQSVGTLGRQLEEGAKEVTIAGERISVKAHIESIKSFSAHRDVDGLLNLLETAVDSAGKPTAEKVFVIHGELKVALFFTQRVRDYLGLKAEAPERGKGYEVDF